MEFFLILILGGTAIFLWQRIGQLEWRIAKQDEAIESLRHSLQERADAPANLPDSVSVPTVSRAAAIEPVGDEEAQEEPAAEIAPATVEDLQFRDPSRRRS